MFIFIIGTSGEAIKVAPVVRLLSDAGHESVILNTNQQPRQVRTTLSQLKVPSRIIDLANGWRGRDLESLVQVPLWLSFVLVGLLREAARIHRYKDANTPEASPIVVVHGDTMTTVIGAIFGKLCGARVAHVEAGMRSGDIRNPFPEEINRRIVAKLSDLNFAPGPEASRNLETEDVRGKIIDTGCNTVLDSLKLALDIEPESTSITGLANGTSFALVSLHRLELLRDSELFSATLQTIAAAASPSTPLVLVGHAPTLEVIRRLNLDKHLGPSLLVADRVDYISFVHLVARCSFVLTDSGGLQEECFLLGKPCLVLRRVTEHRLDPAASIEITAFREDVITQFIACHSGPAADEVSSLRTSGDSPSRLIVEALIQHRGWV